MEARVSDEKRQGLRSSTNPIFGVSAFSARRGFSFVYICRFTYFTRDKDGFECEIIILLIVKLLFCCLQWAHITIDMQLQG